MSMDNKVMWAIRDARGLKMSDKACLWAMASRGGDVWANQETLSADMGANIKTFRSAARRLEDMGLVSIEHRTGTSNLYKINADEVLALPKVVDPTPTKTGTPTESGTSTKTGRTPLPKQVEGSTKTGRTPLPKLVDKEEQKKNLKKNVKKNSENASVADAPEAANLDSHEPKDASDSETSSESTSNEIPELDTSFEPSTAGGGDASSSEIDTSSEPSIDEDQIGEPAQPAEPARNYGALNQRQIEHAAQMLSVTCTVQARRNIYTFEQNRKKIVLRAGKPEFYNLETAKERCEAALTALMAERK